MRPLRAPPRRHRLVLRLLIVALVATTAGCAGGDGDGGPAPASKGASPDAPEPAAGAPEVILETSMGEVRIALYPERAPVSTENFLRYVDSGFYDGTIFHRVVPGFVVQGGGFTEEMEQKPTREPIPNEADNGVGNVRGTVAMARTSDPDSATSQFYVNLADNSRLDAAPGRAGYTVFGVVVDGMEAIDRIARIPTGTHHGPEVPRETVVVERAHRSSGG